MALTFDQLLKGLSVIVLYLVFNTTINLFNRWCLGVYGFSFPVSVTVFHFAFASVALTPLMLGVDSYKKQHRYFPERRLKVLCMNTNSLGRPLRAQMSPGNLSPIAKGKCMQHNVEAWAKDWRGYVATGVFTAINVAFNNSSLVYLSLSMNQVITASMPVLTCAFAICIEK
eukprot:4352510-Pyramimonas_sp.AAC.1